MIVQGEKKNACTTFQNMRIQKFFSKKGELLSKEPEINMKLVLLYSCPLEYLLSSFFILVYELIAKVLKVSRYPLLLYCCSNITRGANRFYFLLFYYFISFYCCWCWCFCCTLLFFFFNYFEITHFFIFFNL